MRRAEYIFSANYFGMDEDKGLVDGEKILDRIAAIPFQEWDDMPAVEFVHKQNNFKKVVDNPAKPTELLIGEIGDYLRSEEFAEKRLEMARMLRIKTEESIKPRTFLTNYAPFYAILWKLADIFGMVWEETGHSWDGFLEWVDNVHAPFLKKQHQEKDHSKHSIRRYINDLLNFICDWSIVERRKLLKICETSKLKNSQKYCLAFHPSPRYVDFQEVGGVKLKDLKRHTNAVGGAWGEDTWANLVKDTCDVAFETPEDEAAGLEDTKAKRAVLIPMNVFTSTQIIKIASMLGQTEDYKKFGADEETPSGVEDIRNSTQRSGSSLNLVLNDLSSINGPVIDEEADAEIIFDELEPIAEGVVLEETEEFLQEETDVYDNTTLEEETNIGEQDTTAIDDDDTLESDGIDFTEVNTSAKKSPKRDPRTKMKAKSSSTREISIIEKGNSTFFVCVCGYESTNKSGTSRHKCKKPIDVCFPCKECDTVCRNAGSLKRHINSKHGSVSSVTRKNTNRQSISLPAVVRFDCTVCDKVFKSSYDFEAHKESHGNSVSSSSRSNSMPVTDGSDDANVQGFPCDVCGKVLKSGRNLDNHKQKVHGTSSTVLSGQIFYCIIPFYIIIKFNLIIFM